MRGSATDVGKLMTPFLLPGNVLQGKAQMPFYFSTGDETLVEPHQDTSGAVTGRGFAHPLHGADALFKEKTSLPVPDQTIGFESQPPG